MKKLHVVVAGQFPPPIGGQNINVRRVYDLLVRTRRYTVSHWKFGFTRQWREGRSFGAHKVIELLRVIYRLMRIRADARIDFVLLPAGGPHLVPILRDMVLLPAASLCSARVCLHFRAAGVAESIEVMPRVLSALVRFVYRSFATEAAVLTEFGLRDPQALGIANSWVVPNALEDRGRIETGRELRLGGESGRLVFLNVGHLCADKGTPELIRAFAEVAEKYPNVSLRLVGEPLAPYTEGCLSRDISQSGCAAAISWIGVKTEEELEYEYENCDVFVFSSIAPYESFGMVLVEAMMWSKPVISTDWRGNREVLGSQFGGILVDVEGDLSKSLACAMSRAAKNRQKLEVWGEANRRVYENAYDIGILENNLHRMIMQGSPSL